MSHAARNSSFGPGAGTPAEGTAEGLRVVLVGQTGLDQSLRREASLEVYRARTSFEAVGELGTPIGADSPRDALVIVAPGTVTQEEMSALTAALRRVEPGVCVAGLLETAAARAVAPDPKMFGLEAWLVPPVSAGVLRLLVRNRGVASGADAVERGGPVFAAEAPGLTPETVLVAAPAPVPSAPTSTVVMRPAAVPSVMSAPISTGNAPSLASAPSFSPATVPGPAPSLVPSLATNLAPLHALLAGGDVVTAYLSALRSSPGGRFSECAFVPAGTEPGAADASVRVPVVHKGHTFGVLSARVPVVSAEEAALREAAAELAAWLALREQQSQLRRAAFTDPLTGAWNRRYFDGFLARALSEARAARHDVSLLLFDIDDFKRYNDLYGHGAGDEILVGVVGLLKSVVRASDRVCRLGGDEFGVIFHEPTGPRDPGSHHPASILTLARRFQKQVAQARFRKLGDEARGNLGVSGGLATFPWDGNDAESLLEHADRLLCESKGKGKNVIRLGPGAAGTLSPEDTRAG